MKLIVNLSVLFFAVSINAAVRTVPVEETNPLAQQMASKFEDVFERDLDPEERSALEAYAAQVEDAGSSLYPQTASLDSENEDVTTIMFCLGAKGGIYLKLGGNVCVSSSGTVYIISAGGMGLSFGVAATGSVLIHKGHLGSVKGQYKGISGGLSGLGIKEGMRIATKNLLHFAGGEVSYFDSQESDSEIILAGVTFGPMVDLSMIELHIR